MSTQAALPSQFDMLEPYLDWALPTEVSRLMKRESSSLAEIRAFYDAVLAQTPAIVAYLRQAGQTEQTDTRTQTLYRLMLAFADASLSVELHRSPTVPDGMPGEIWKPEHETQGWRNKPAIQLQPRP